MIISPKIEARPRTGITVPSSAGGRLRKALDTARAMSPILQKVARPALSNYGVTSRKLTVAPFDIRTLDAGYATDGYIKQATDKYAELVLKEGWKLVGGDEQTEYLTRRFHLMGLMSDPPEFLESLVSQIVADFIRYGNALVVLKRSSYLASATGGAIKGLGGRAPIAAYFPMPLSQMEPEVDKAGKVFRWKQTTNFRAEKTFSLSDILHFTYGRQPGEIWGVPYYLPVIEDVKALRQIEENVLKLIYKHLNPLIHQEIPDITGTGEGRQEDIDNAIEMVAGMAVDGYIVTPPGHKIQAIGAESQALRVAEYLKAFKQRVFSGLGVSSLVMGESEGTALGTAESLTLQMHNKARVFQYILSQYLTNFILNELLLEGGFNPYVNDADRVVWQWNELETERRIKEQTHYLNMWAMNALSAEEFRELAKLPVGDINWQNFYVHQVQIPQLLASKLGIDPLLLDPKDFVKPADRIDTRDRTKKDSILGQGGDASPPSNQHSPGNDKQDLSDAVGVLATIYDRVLGMVPEVRAGRLFAKDVVSVLNTLLPDCSAQALGEVLFRDMVDSDETTAYLRVNARLSNERAVILAQLYQEDEDDSG